jgi:hypothetical protein
MKITHLLVSTLLTLSLSIYFDIINLLSETRLWFQSSGSLLIVLGILFESKYILRSSEENITTVSDLTILSGHAPKPSSLESPI